MRTFARSVALITVFSITTRALGFLFRIFLSRILGAELLGLYQIAFSFFMVFMMAISSGIPLAISRQVAAQRDASSNNKSQTTQKIFSLKQIIKAGLIISLGTSIVLIALTFALYRPLSLILTDYRSISVLMVFLPALFAYSVYTVFRSIWWGQKKFALLGLTELIEQVARVIIFLLLLSISFVFTDMAIAAALSFTLACFVSAIIVVILYIRGRKSRKNTTTSTFIATQKQLALGTPIKPLLRTSTPITAVKVITTIAFPIIAIVLPNRLISAGWTSSEALAHFGILVGMTLPLLSIPQALISSMATALVPELSAAESGRDKSKVERQIITCIKFTLFVNFLLFPAFVALGPSIGVFLFASTQAGIYLAHAAWIMIPMSLSLITNAILNALGHETRAMAHYVIGSIALFISIWILPQFIGIGALIVGMGVCMSIASILNIVKIANITGTDAKILRLVAGFFLISIPSILAGRFIFGVISYFMPLFFGLAFASIATFAVLITLAHVFKLVELNELREKLRRRKKPGSVVDTQDDASAQT